MSPSQYCPFYKITASLIPGTCIAHEKKGRNRLVHKKHLYYQFFCLKLNR